MTLFLVIVTAGLIYAACAYDLNLFWFIGAAVLVQILRNVLWPKEPELGHDERQKQLVMKDFFSSMRYSPWSKFFSSELAKEKLQETNEIIIKALYEAIQDELEVEHDETYCKNLQYVLIDIRQEIANRQIEAYRHSKREKKGNYARIYANSLELPLTSMNLSDEEALKNATQYSTAELVHVVLDVPDEIFDTTAELTTGRDEEMEAYYHNNLRKIEFVLRLELAKRFLESKGERTI